MKLVEYLSTRYLKKSEIMRTLLLAALFAVSTLAGYSQDKKPKSPPATAKATFEGIDIEVNYSQPSVKGREIWGDLVPYGKVWRTGANNATTISFSKDVKIDGQTLPAGTYALFTIPNESDFTFIFNKEAEQWGAYKYDESKDALRVQTESREVKEHQEVFTIEVDDKGQVILKWDHLMVSFRITA